MFQTKDRRRKQIKMKNTAWSYPPVTFNIISNIEHTFFYTPAFSLK